MRNMPVKIIKNQKSKIKVANQNLKILNFGLSFWILIFGFWIYSYAAPCYGTKMPKKKELFGGIQTHAIFKRYLEDEYGKLRSTQHFVLLSWGVYDWLSIDLKGGVGYIKQHPVGGDEVDYDSSFSGGYGFRLKLYDEKKNKIVFGFQHISIHPPRIYLEGARHKAVLDDWQFSLLASRDFLKITPYLGTKWSRTDYIHWVGDNRKREKSALTKSVGLVFGFDLPVAEKVWFNLEGQLFDSEAFAFSMNFNF